jgi:hypothetical protein
MTTAELKKSLHSDIENINESEKLENLKTFIDTYILNPGEPEFTPEQLKQLDTSRKQAEQGIFISNEDVDKEIDEWLKK